MRARYGVEVCPVIIHQRAIFAHALIGSRCAQEVEPGGKAALEVAALWDWLAGCATGREREPSQFHRHWPQSQTLAG
jgi:chromosome partitioning protein